MSYRVEANREEAAENAGLLISHRGACTLAPENSLPAFRLAGELGYWGAECDVSVTKDGFLVLMHDSTVNRTTNGRGLVNSFTLEEIRKLKIDVGANVRYYTDLQVPTLEEFLQICKEYGMTPVIELKILLEDANYDTLISLFAADRYGGRGFSYFIRLCKAAKAAGKKPGAYHAAVQKSLERYSRFGFDAGKL